MVCAWQFNVKMTWIYWAILVHKKCNTYLSNTLMNALFPISSHLCLEIFPRENKKKRWKFYRVRLTCILCKCALPWSLYLLYKIIRETHHDFHSAVSFAFFVWCGDLCPSWIFSSKRAANIFILWHKPIHNMNIRMVGNQWQFS